MKGFRVLMVLVLAFFIAAVTLPEKSRAEESKDQTHAVLVLEQARQNHIAKERWEALRTKNAVARNISSSPSQWLTRVNASEVNMVTNRHEKKTQQELRLDNKVYYAADEACAKNMAMNPSTRFAKDPLTNNTVDKAGAVVYADASGAVYYFETNSTFAGLMALAEKDTVYGYTSPK